MDYLEVIKEWKSKKFRPLYFLHGEEPYFMDVISDYAEKHILNESEKAFNFMVMYGRDTDHLALVDNARRYPMMAERQVIILKEAQQMKDLSSLEKYCEQPMATTVLIICHKYKKLDMRTTLAKALKKTAVLIECKKIYDNKMPEWISAYIKEKGYEVQQQAVMMINEYLGNDLAKVANELDKLCLNKEKGKAISTGDVQKFIGISKDYNIFELQAALADRNVAKSNRIIKYFIANPKENPIPKTIGSMYNFYSKLYMYQFLGKISDMEKAKKMGFRSDWFLRDYKKAAMRYSLADTEKVIGILKEYDLRSKGVDNNSVSEGELTREMIYKILH